MYGDSEDSEFGWHAFGDGESNLGNGDGCGLVFHVDQLLKGRGLSWAVGEDGNGYGARYEQYE